MFNRCVLHVVFALPSIFQQRGCKQVTRVFDMYQYKRGADHLKQVLLAVITQNITDQYVKSCDDHYPVNNDKV